MLIVRASEEVAQSKGGMQQSTNCPNLTRMTHVHSVDICTFCVVDMYPLYDI